ncbi:dnaJ homolog subfamily C member 3-like [Octopus vulgaris]|uniref:DnaJ homolog subfamily C member 3-like n=3 Tax=Octopus TaxID=6643 RepID=A0AA36F4N6_OCTVU|nr:dnaJ homolog subfamily C member 3 [Octopus sinensis]CAI9725631.1 dnaJ homolog subfamily C member 3-like [Octopus vulgaris]CAI9725632.1 dnaJ homolog subfamily C member 3-like [Octopus vulgaris]
MLGSSDIPPLVALVFSITLKLSGALGDNVEEHLEMGKTLLAQGKLTDALSHYHAAVEGDPSNYLTYYKRATVFLALGKSRSAQPDLDRVLELKPNFNAARMQRGNVLLKQGQLDEAKDDYTTVLKFDPNHSQAQKQLDLIDPLKAEISEAKARYKSGDHQAAIDHLTKAIEVCPWSPELKEIRSECYIALGDLLKAIHDIRPTTKLRNDNTAAFLKLSLLHYQLGEADDSLSQIRECLKLDPDHKDCFQHYKKVKKLVKLINAAQEQANSQSYEECIQKANQILEMENKNQQFILKGKSFLCHCNSKAGFEKEAIKKCSEVLTIDSNNVDAYCDRAEAYIKATQYNDAVNDYQQAQNIDSESHRVQEGLEKAKKILKQSKRRDYYKILGVRRNADKRTILRAYRKLAVKWHPDKYDNEEDKKNAQQHFIDIAAAKEVLTNPEKRQKFDHGEDPLDPENQNEHGGGPFWHQGFNPFESGGGFQFKFHFN